MDRTSLPSLLHSRSHNRSRSHQRNSHHIHHQSRRYHCKDHPIRYQRNQRHHSCRSLDLQQRLELEELEVHAAFCHAFGLVQVVELASWLLELDQVWQVA